MPSQGKAYPICSSIKCLNLLRINHSHQNSKQSHFAHPQASHIQLPSLSKLTHSKQGQRQHIFDNKMKARNPFTSLSNYSFVRNAQNFSTQASSRTHSISSHKKYFDYQGSYLRDSYLKNCQHRRNQQQINSKLIGIEALRFAPRSQIQEQRGCPISKGLNQNSKAEYYNLQNHHTEIDLHGEQPLAKTKSHSRIQKLNAAKETSMCQSIASQRAMKCSTKDMFGSDYFNNRHGAFQSQEQRGQEDKFCKKSSFHKKGGNNASRLKVTHQEPKELSQLKQKQEESRVKMATPKKWSQCAIKQAQGPPETLFLKSRSKLFYLYHEQSY